MADFTSYTSKLQRSESTVPADSFYGNLGPLGYYDSMVLRAEQEWHRYGQPDYRIYPDIAAALGKTDLDIEGRFLLLPFPTFAVSFPPRMVVSDNDEEIPGVLVTSTSEVMGGALVRKLVVIAPEGQGIKPSIYRFPVVADKPLKSQVGAFFQTDDGEGNRRVVGPDTALWLVTVAAATAIFSGGLTRTPYVTETKLDQTERKQRAQARQGTTHVYDVGKEVKLYFYDDIPVYSGCDSDPDEEGGGNGKPLKWAHPRRGHLRNQPYGSRSAPSYKIIFLPPTIIRGDLPMRKLRPFAVRATR